MLTAELKEYLGMMADLERDLYTQLKIEELIHKKMGEYYVLTVERTYEEYCKNHFYDTTLPMLPNGDAPIKPIEPQKDDFKGKDFRASIGLLLLTCVAGIIFPPCVIIIPLIARHKQKTEGENLYKKAFEEYTKQKIKYDEYAEKQKAYREKQEQNKRYHESWNREKENYKTRSAWSKIKSEPYTVMCQKVQMQRDNTQKSLQKLYSKCNIYYKYQNLAAVCSLYDSIATGICTRLEGPDGAYNKYDVEMRMDKMITQLDEVIENLHIIQNNQNKLYSEMRGISQKIDRLQLSMNEIARQLDCVIAGLGAIYEQGERRNTQLATIRSQTEKLLESSELSNYLAECNQRELHYMNRMNYLAGHYDNPYGNYAPV